MKKMEKHHSYFQKLHQGKIIILKKEKKYLCMMHKVPLDCENMKHLQTHYYLYLRHQSDEYLVQFNLSSYAISDLPVYLTITMHLFMKETNRMNEHRQRFGDPIYFDDFHKVQNPVHYLKQ